MNFIQENQLGPWWRDHLNRLGWVIGIIAMVSVSSLAVALIAALK
jgi:hypothetical protein